MKPPKRKQRTPGTTAKQKAKGLNERILELEAANKELQEKYQAYTTGNAQYYHDVWCSASRNEPMGCPGCSCTIGKEIKSLNKRLLELEAEHTALRNELQSTVDAAMKDDTVVGRLAILDGRIHRWKVFLEYGNWL